MLHLLAAAFGGGEEAEHITKAIQSLSRVATQRDMSPGLLNADAQKAAMQARAGQMNNIAAMRQMGHGGAPAMGQVTPPPQQAAA